jgi:peptide/nickel transport system substrate-binding protein
MTSGSGMTPPAPIYSRNPSMPSPRYNIVGASLILTLLAGCGDSTLRGLPEFCQEVLPRVDAWVGGQEQPMGPRYGGTAVVGGVGEIAGGLNALITSDHFASQHQLYANLMTLVRLDQTLEFEPYLARSWEVDEEAGQLTFHLRDDVFWHDGTPTTAHDVAFTFERVTDPATGFPNAAFWDRYEGVEVVDSFTVRLSFEPYPYYMDAWRAVAIMPRHLLEEVPPEELRSHPIGTRCPVGNGPFVFVEHRQDESWTFRRNPAFPGELGGSPYLDRYIYRPISETTTLLAELLTGNIDVYIAPHSDFAERIREADDLEFRAFPFRGYAFIAWNQRRPQLADARVRRAIAMGTNRREILEAIRGGYGTVANAGVPPFHWGYHEGIEDALPYDPEGARRLLDEAGWVDRNGDGIRENADGVPLAISVLRNQGERERQEMLEIMQAQLREVGIALTPEGREWTAIGARIMDVENRDFDGAVLSFVTEFNLDEHDLFHSRMLDQLYQWAGMNDPRIDRLLDALRAEPDRDRARELWREYQELIVELQPYTYFFFADRLVGINRRLQGAVMDVRGEWVSLRDWWIPEEGRRGRTR